MLTSPTYLRIIRYTILDYKMPETKHSITFTKSQWEQIQSVMISYWESKGLTGNSLAPYTHLDRITEYNVRENEYKTNESQLEGWTESDSDKHILHRQIYERIQSVKDKKRK